MPRHAGTTRGASSSSSRGGARASGARGSGSAEERETKISKATSYVLRHGAEKEGVKLDENGYANVAELLSWPRLSSLSVTFAELQSIVVTNAKQRFTLIPLPSPPSASPSSASASPSPPPFPDSTNPAHHLIRATQGHSLPIASANLLTPILATDPDCPREVVHGTYASAWKSIQQSGGLRPMGRTHVHFALGPVTPQPRTQTPAAMVSNDAAPLAPDSPSSSTIALLPAVETPAASSPSTTAPLPAAEPVISGMRASATVLVWVDVQRSLADGLTWWRSANGVVLTEGDKDGVVRTEWISRVQIRKPGGKWEDGGWAGGSGQ